MGGSEPFFSPDSQWIGFFAQGQLKKVSIKGGAPLTLADGVGPYGCTWSSNDTIIFERGAFGNAHLFTIPASGGAPQPLTALETKKSELVLGWPDFLPGAKAVLFAASSNSISWSEAQLSLYVSKTGERRLLNQTGMRPRYARSGHLVYAQGGNLMAAPFDVGRLELTGPAIPVVDGVWQFAQWGTAQYSFSDNGTLAYISGAPAIQSRLVWVDRAGVEQSLAAPIRPYTRPRISPDGRHVAVEIGESGGQVWIYDLARETLTRLTLEGTGNGLVAWTPDGKRVAFTSGAPGNLFWQMTDGSGKAERLTTGASEGRQLASSWSPDGQALAFVDGNLRNGGQQIWVFRPNDRKSQLLIESSAPSVRVTSPKFSPDGGWLAYASNESGDFQIYVRPYPGLGQKLQVSTDGGTEPVWNPKGRELFYRNGDKMMAAQVATQPSFSAGRPKVLFEGHYATAASIPDYDVSSDGQRFLMVKAGQEQSTTQINIVQNWFEELKQKVPAGKE